MRITKLASPLLRGLLLAVASVSFLPGHAVAAETCATSSCHTDLTALSQPHSPAETGDCDLCHEQQSGEHPSGAKADFALIAKGAQLCFQCHEQNAFANRRYTHSPVRDGECTVCHDPHGSTGESPSATNADLTSLCTTCHDSFDQPHLHGPAAVGACTACHEPHASEHDSLLKKESRAVCLGCHADFAKGMASSPYLHAPVKEQSCTACHDPHQAIHPNLLADKMPDICFNCHDTMADKLRSSRTKHPVLQEKNSCATCHSTHYSQTPGLLGQEQKTLCLSCHGKNDQRKSDSLKNIATELEGKNFLHGPLEDGECGACHDPHGSDYFKMFRASYPEDFYAPYREDTYAFCLSCHEQLMLKYEDTSIYTQFRNGKRNLHYVHVSKARKGRTCRACHEPHASNQNSLISVTGPAFGDWRIPTHFRQSETGGSCMPGCHRELAYDRDNPIDYGPQ